MEPRPSIVVTIRVVPESEPISGELDHDGHTSRFTGWLDLTQALERAVMRDSVDSRPREDAGHEHPE